MSDSELFKEWRSGMEISSETVYGCEFVEETLEVGHTWNPCFTGTFLDGFGWSLWVNGVRSHLGLFHPQQYPPSPCPVCNRPSTNLTWYDRYESPDYTMENLPSPCPVCNRPSTNLTWHDRYESPDYTMENLEWRERILHYRCSDPHCRMAGGVRVTPGGRMKADKSPTQWRVRLSWGYQ